MRILIILLAAVVILVLLAAWFLAGFTMTGKKADDRRSNEMAV